MGSTKPKHHGIWEDSYRLYTNPEDTSTDEKLEVNLKELKDALIKDHEFWILSSGLLATIGFGGLFGLQAADQIRDGIDWFEQWVLLIFVTSMTLSSLFAFSCMNDFMTLVSFYVMTPPKHIINARDFTYLHYKNTVSKSFNRRIFKFFGVEYGYKVFYLSLKLLLVGMNAGIYLAYPHDWRLSIPSIVLSIFIYLEMCNYNQDMHWGNTAYPRFAQMVLNGEYNEAMHTNHSCRSPSNSPRGGRFLRSSNSSDCRRCRSSSRQRS